MLDPTSYAIMQSDQCLRTLMENQIRILIAIALHLNGDDLHNKLAGASG